MTSTKDTQATIEADIEADIAALRAHVSASEGPHRAAFQSPAVPIYAVGDIVWLWDDCSTATVVGQAANGNWLVLSVNYYGDEFTLSYRAQHIRPAAKPHVFVWPSKR